MPGLVSHVVEPALGILADTWRRRALILAGGLAYGLSAILTASSTGFWLLLLSFMLFSPASGAFVNVSEISLMDFDPRRKVQNMARWAFAGSIGMTVGPLAVAASGPIGWRGLYLILACFLFVLVALAWRFPLAERRPSKAVQGWPAFRKGLRGALRAFRRGEVLRWLALLQSADLTQDVLFGFLALYFVDVVGVSVKTAASAVVIWTVAGLIGDFLIIPLLEKVRALSYLRASAAVMVVAFPAFLVAGSMPIKLTLLGLIGIAKSGWYPILQARLYDALPGKAGSAMAVGNIAGLAGGLIPLGLGAVAQSAGLGFTLWLLLAGPIALLTALPRGKEKVHGKR